MTIDDEQSRGTRPAEPSRDHRGFGQNLGVAFGVLAGFVFVAALGLRLFAFDWFSIPSASQEPNIIQGDYILVSKSAYGWGRYSIPFSAPFAGRIGFRSPQRGDVVVFRLPRDTRVDYIKRLVGLPGDRIQLKGGVVYVNGTPLAREPLAPAMGNLPDGYGPVERFMESAPNGRRYVIQKGPGIGPADDTGVYIVPPHCYFVLGDNRDNALDSRFDPSMPVAATDSPTCGWDSALDQNVPQEPGVGYVPEENLIGKAVMVLFSRGDASTGLRRDRTMLPVS
jgi:signal peptidase I